MRAFFDTSALVPVFYGDHPHHHAGFDVFAAASREHACCGAHSLAEVYSTLTRMPGRYRVSGEDALLFIGDIRARLSVIPLITDDDAVTLEECARRGISGGAVYDALLVRCALNAGAEVIYTWNPRHYSLFGADLVRRIRTP